MKTSQKGIEFITREEGCRLKAYLDAVGLPTIGVGHLIKPGEKFTALTQAESDALLAADLVQFEDAVNEVGALAQHEFDAAVSLAFNIGAGALKKSTLRRKLKASDKTGAALEFAKWNKAGGQILKGLVNRRARERRLFETGKYE